MGSTRRSFTEEYKDQAVAFVIEGNRSVADVAGDIGVHEMTLGRWVKKTRDSQREQIPPDAELTGSERLELIRLRAELKDEKATIAELQMQVEFAAIADWADSNSYPVAFMCVELGVSRSGYYAWRTAAPSQRSKDDTTLIAIMKKLHAEARGNPGVRRLHAGLAALGHRLSRKRVWRLMKVAGLRGRHPKAWKRTTIGGDKPVPAPDLIGRSFWAERPNEKWCGDITYVKTWDGWAYVAT